MTTTEPSTAEPGSEVAPADDGQAPAGTELARYDADARAIVVPTNIPGYVLTFTEGQTSLDAKQMHMLAPIGVEADWDPAQVAVFLLTSLAQGLDPWRKQVYLLLIDRKYVRHTSIGGLLSKAEETGLYRGTLGPQFCGPDGVWRDVWLDGNTPPAGARVGILRAGFDTPVWGVATYEEYAPMIDEWADVPGQNRRARTGRKRPTRNWAPARQGGKPAVMLEKCLPGKTLIRTERGLLPIGRIVQERMAIRVLSVDLLTGRQTYRPVVSWFRNPGTDRWVRLRCADGSRGTRPLRLTPDHPVWTPKGWAKAGELRAGDQVALAAPSLSEDQHQVILGGLLGDGHLGGRKKSTALPFYEEAHSVAQEGYTRWKAAALANLSARVDLATAGAGTGKRHPVARLRTAASPALARYRGMRPADMLYWINALGLAVWLMDDGSIGPTPNAAGDPAIRLYCCGFGADFADEAVRFFREKYGVEARVNRRDNNPYLYIGAKGTAHLLSLLADYLVYDPEAKAKKWVAGPVDVGPVDGSVFVPLISVEEYVGREKEGRYDIEVEGTHTFVTSGGMVVSNCAKARGLRDAFPDKCGGFYVGEETEKSRADSEAARDQREPAAEDDASRRRRAAFDAAMAQTANAGEFPVFAGLGVDDERARELLLAELDEQATILGKTRGEVTARWVASRGGALVETWPLRDLSGAVRALRQYVLTALREDGRDAEADRYMAAPDVGTVDELFGRNATTIDGEAA